jgi:hypothetical protein
MNRTIVWLIEEFLDRCKVDGEEVRYISPPAVSRKNTNKL